MLKRERRRYLVLKVVSEQLLNGREVLNTVEASVLMLFGEYGVSQANLRIIDYDLQRSQSVIRCSHKALEKVRASIASITEINGKIAAIHVVGVSGTLKALSKKT